MQIIIKIKRLLRAIEVILKHVASRIDAERATKFHTVKLYN